MTNFGKFITQKRNLRQQLFPAYSFELYAGKYRFKIHFRVLVNQGQHLSGYGQFEVLLFQETQQSENDLVIEFGSRFKMAFHPFQGMAEEFPYISGADSQFVYDALDEWKKVFLENIRESIFRNAHSFILL